MDRKERARQLLDKLNALKKKNGLTNLSAGDLTDDMIQKGISDFSEKLRENPTVRVIQRFADEMEKFKADFNLGPITESVKALQRDIEDSEKKLLTEFSTKLEELAVFTELRDGLESVSRDVRTVPILSQKVETLKAEFEKRLEDTHDQEMQKDVQDIQKQMQDLVSQGIESGEELRAIEKNLEGKIDKLRKDFLNRISQRGGGEANRQINFNSSVMSTRYTDMNFVRAGNIGWSVSDDDVNRRVNISASLLAGGGGSGGSVFTAIGLTGTTSGQVIIEPASVAGTWKLTLPVNDGNPGQYLLTDGNGITQWSSVTATGGSGITRISSVISVSSTFSAVAATDYVAFTNVGLVMTLPTAVGNLNLYTVKNMATSSVLIAAGAGENIDGSATALLTTQYQALTFASNSSVWGVL